MKLSLAILAHWYGDLLGTEHGGNKGRGRKPMFPQHFGSLAGQMWETASHFTWPRVGVWLWEATESQLAVSGQEASLGNRLSVLGIPDTAGHRGRAENKMGVSIY